MGVILSSIAATMSGSRITRRAFGVSSFAWLSAARAASPLDQSTPGVARALPRIELASLPTPVTRALGLGRALGIESLYLKRDDLSAEAYAGGKVRKLERFLAGARASGASRVVTIGGVNSHHALATAVYASQIGLGATLLLLPEPPSAAIARKLQTEHALGATLRLIPNQAAAQRELVRASLPGTGTYAIPTGGSSPLGNLGFIDAGLELGAQVRAGALPEPDVVFLALGTMGSAVGLSIGLELAGLRSELVAVRASSPSTSSLTRLEAAYAETVAFLRGLDPAFPALEFPKSRLTLEGRYLGGGYALATRAGERARTLARESEGLALEPTYTAKTLAALTAAAPSLRGRVVLFWLSHAAKEPELPAATEPLPRELRGYVTADEP
jgi:D-cysteine desulfhydrase